MNVVKVGRTTGRTKGRVVDADAVSNLDFGPPVGLKFFTRGIIIQSTKVSGCCCCTCTVLDPSKKFADDGDSGSVLVSEQRMAVGLILAKGTNDAFACRMTEVESGMNITINRTVVIGPPSLEVHPEAVPAPHAGGGAPFAATVPAAFAEDDTVWSIMQRRLEETPFGREVGAQVRQHLPEAIDLVNHHRAVMVAWQRVQGPSFLAQ
jgi:hypothetical protein